MQPLNGRLTVFVLTLLNLLILSGSWAQDTVFVMPRATDVDISVKCSAIREDEAFRYEYEVQSSEKSRQDLFEFYVEYGSNVLSVTSPAGWAGAPSDIRKIVLMWTSRDPSTDLPPGRMLSGFAFESRGLPSITTFYARGAFGEPVFPEGQAPPLDSVVGVDVFENSTKGRCIAPFDPPDPLVPVGFLETVISYKHQAVALGWIDNEGIANSLDVKLENVKKQLERGNTKTAKNVLRAFLNEVEAQKDKHLSSEAYALLKFNGEFLLSKL